MSECCKTCPSFEICVLSEGFPTDPDSVPSRPDVEKSASPIHTN